MKLWIARRKSNKLYMFFDKPMLTDDSKSWFVLKSIPHHGLYADSGIQINKDMFPEVTFENSPKEIELKLI